MDTYCYLQVKVSIKVLEQRAGRRRLLLNMITTLPNGEQITLGSIGEAIPKLAAPTSKLSKRKFVDTIVARGEDIDVEGDEVVRMEVGVIDKGHNLVKSEMEVFVDNVTDSKAKHKVDVLNGGEVVSRLSLRNGKRKRLKLRI